VAPPVTQNASQKSSEGGKKIWKFGGQNALTLKLTHKHALILKFSHGAIPPGPGPLSKRGEGQKRNFFVIIIIIIVYHATIASQNIFVHRQIYLKSYVAKSRRKNSGIPHILSPQHSRMSTDHISNVKRCTYFFSDMPRSFAHYFHAVEKSVANRAVVGRFPY